DHGNEPLPRRRGDLDVHPAPDWACGRPRNAVGTRAAERGRPGVHGRHNACESARRPPGDLALAERPRVYNVEGVILRRRNIGEADSIFTVLSPYAGKFDAVARGVRKPRSRMRGHLEPLTRCRLLLAR